MEVQRELSKVISQEMKDPRIDPLTSVIAVEVTPDLKQAKVYVSVLGTEEKKQATLEGLRSAAPFIRRHLASTINLRNTPELRFYMDESIEYGVHMSQLIEEVNKGISHDEDDM